MLAAAHALCAESGPGTSAAEINSICARKRAEIIASDGDLLVALKDLLRDSACPLGHGKMERWSRSCDKARAAIDRVGGNE